MQYFFKVAGIADPFLVTIITFVLLIVSIFSSLIACEYIGRRPLLVGGCFVMCIFYVALATTGFFVSAGSKKAALGFLLLWVICYGCSAGPIGFVAAGETSTPRLRAQTTSFNLGCYGAGFVVFQWTVSYMISPDAANLGVKAVYVWAGLLVPTVVLLWLFYPEVRRFARPSCTLLTLYRRTAARTGNSTSFTRGRSQHGNSRTLKLCQNGMAKRTRRLCVGVLDPQLRQKPEPEPKLRLGGKRIQIYGDSHLLNHYDVKRLYDGPICMLERLRIT